LKKIAILGSTGTLGVHALEIIEDNPQLFKAEVLTAHKNATLAIAQANKFKPRLVCFNGLDYDKNIVDQMPKGTEVLFGKDSMRMACSDGRIDFAFISVVGIAGLPALVECINNNLQIALANKESLVCGGHIIRKMMDNKETHLLPVDSELSAVFQCLHGNFETRCVRRILLTASGGPFRKSTMEEIYNAKPEQALKHPNWSMGKKITVDCATMVNKALEVMETRWLFDIQQKKIEVVIHPQSIIHSMVEYKNGAVMAQLSPTNMKQPIQYAFSWPDKLPSAVGYLDFKSLKMLEFEEPDTTRFPALKMAYECLNAGGGASTIFNGANEAAVEAFLDGKLPMGKIIELIQVALDKYSGENCDTIEEVYDLDNRVKEYIRKVCAKEYV
jgi:1-deoxy-D-xylulose-5-phosphate reductoisomerase